MAVKTLSSQEPAVVAKFLEEADLMKKFTHPNIVSILGRYLCLERSSGLSLSLSVSVLVSLFSDQPIQAVSLPYVPTGLTMYQAHIVQ